MHEDREMDRIMATSPLLAKVARGAHLSVGGYGGAAVAADFFEDVSDRSKRPEDAVAASGNEAVPNLHDIPGIGVPEPEADISDRTEEGGFLPAVHAAPSVEQEMMAETKPGDDRLKGFVPPASQLTGEKVPGIGVPEPEADISDRTEESGFLPAVHAAPSVEEEIKVERKPGDDRLKGFVPPASQLTGEKVPGIGVPEPEGNEFETAGGEIFVQGSGPSEDQGASPTKNRLQTLQAADFRSRHEKRREKGKALKPLFPAHSPEPENDGRLSVMIARGKDAGMLPREGEQDEYGGPIDTGALLSRKSLNTPPDRIKGFREDHLRKEDPVETVMPTSPLEPDKETRRTMENPLDSPFSRNDGFEPSAGKAGLAGAIVKRPVLKRDFFAPPREASMQEMPVRREGRVKIGKINILVKGREKTENEGAWPEAPAYTDHLITEDWEWSCRYGR
jgi:hypothetical protein